MPSLRQGSVPRLTPLNAALRPLFEAQLQPVQGSRFQLTTGFPTVASGFLRRTTSPELFAIGDKAHVGLGLFVRSFHEKIAQSAK